MTNETLTLSTLERDLEDTLSDNRDDILNSEYPEDLLHEYIDSTIPVGNSEILEVGGNSYWLYTEEPEVYGFDGKHTALNAIVGNIYKHLSEKAYEWLEHAQEDKEIAANIPF